MPDRKRVETRSRRDMAQEETNSRGFMAKTGTNEHTSYLASQESINEALRKHGLPPRSQHLPTAYAAIDLPKPATVKEADESDYTEIWRSYGVCGFGGHLQTINFDPAQQPIGNIIDA